MEHEVFVPVPAERLREALADPARVAGAVPGLQQEAGAEPVTGRLKMRVGSHSVTYRGTVRLTARDDGTYAAEGEAVEARGTGTVTLALTVGVTGADGGARLTFTGTATVRGRVTELPRDVVTAAVTRLLTRFGENLGQAAQRDDPVGAEASPSTSGTGVSSPETETETEPETEAGSEGAAVAEPPVAEALSVDDPLPGHPPAEAAHARRTMIGRSAEEVDHAPPRGRYAPVPAPQAAASATSLRWAAPAAALVIASALLAGRVLRRRR